MFLLQQVMQEAKFEEKYGVNVKVDPETGEVSVTKEPKDKTDEIENSSRKKKTKKSAEIKSNKNERRKKKLEETKVMKLEKTRDDFERFQDRVKFGETVHAPPAFTSLPRKADSMDTKDRVCITYDVNKFYYWHCQSIQYTYLLTYLLPYLLHGAESFLRLLLV